jgi:hypothetical protein
MRHFHVTGTEPTMSSWSLNASGQIPATMAADTSADPSAGPVAQNVMATEVELYEALKAILEDPRYGTAASSFGGSHVSGSLHEADA